MKRGTERRSSRGASEIAQFPLALYCMFIVVLLPCLNLVTLLIGGCTAYLATNDIVAKAATQATFAEALNAMAVGAYTFQANTLAQFVKMAPQGGYTGCGNDLYVLATNIGGAGVQSSAADQTLNSTINPTANIYEMQVVSSYSLSPLVSMAAVPLLGSIPGLGQPVYLSFAATRPIEHPGGMQTASNSGSTGTTTAFNRTSSTAPGVIPSANPASWRTPSIYQQIQNSGQTVLSTNVFTVPCNTGDQPNNGWVSSGVTVQSGQNVWIDTQAIGTWTTAAGVTSYTDANGIPEWINTWAWAVDSAAPAGALIGWVGSTPPYVSRDSGGIPGAPNMFSAGDTTLNYSPTTSGPLYMIANDNYRGDNAGAQQVRIIVTK